MTFVLSTPAGGDERVGCQSWSGKRQTIEWLCECLCSSGTGSDTYLTVMEIRDVALEGE